MRVRTLLRVLVVAIAVAGCDAMVEPQDIDPGFEPELVDVSFTSRQIRPGDQFAMTIRFRNGGERPARADYMVFVHFEAPEASCEDIVFQADHPPTVPTSMWQPGEVITEGPHVLRAPEDRPEQQYFVHIGVYDHLETGERLLETYEGGKIAVTSDAPPSESMAPEPLPDVEVARRREAMRQRVSADAAASLETEDWRFLLDPDTTAWLLEDRRTGVVWASRPDAARFGQILLRSGERSFQYHIVGFEEVSEEPGALRLTVRPRAYGEPTGVTVTFTVEPVADPGGLRISYASEEEGQWRVAQVTPLDGALWVTEADDGRLYVPHRLGIELPANEGVPGRQSWTTYNNLSMAMCGAVKQGSALLVNWEKVDTHLRMETSWPDAPAVPGRRMRALTLTMEEPAAAFSLHPLGEGGYMEIARAYRPLAEAKGWRQTWAEKRRDFPSVDRIFGAADFKPFVFSRVLPSSRFNDTDQERTHLGFTFEEVARCAEHWRHDLEIDRAFVVMAGWINGGYDVRHPDILPAAPECGGNEALQEAIARIKRCGYLVGMHDNYQDMYRDAPSWDEEYINTDRQGRLKRGGNWNGGQAWQVCAIKQVELAAREDSNLPRVAQLFDPTIYFIDTTFAWPLVTCHDPDHPMTRRDDLEWKTKLCMLAKQHFGLFGSEEGREWSVPCADYLEGIFGHRTDNPPGDVIPLFPLVYSDCVQIMTHQGNRIAAGDEKKMADHILFAEMHLPRFGNHLYWQDAERNRVPVVPLEPLVEQVGDRSVAITYRWRVEGTIEEDLRTFVHFTHPAATRPEDIAFQDDHLPDPPTSQWQPGSIVEVGPRTVEVPQQFDGRSALLVGMTSDAGRVLLSDVQHSNRRYQLGSIVTAEEGIRFQPADGGRVRELWSRSDGGWAEGMCITDVVIKNTWEVLSPLNVITAEEALASHEFLSDDRLVQRTRFGDVTIIVAYERPAKIDGTTLPPYGFIVQSPTFVAFCATSYAGVEYDTPTLFTARSLDGEPIAQSARVRIYHGFGDPRISLGGRVFEVPREQIISLRG
ncbi:MAG: glycoside hydrolase [Armatimonadota bacterium]|nr:glycoside hydrolase [Armatimonadota bacterium]